jgi:hypothetical protein
MDGTFSFRIRLGLRMDGSFATTATRQASTFTSDSTQALDSAFKNLLGRKAVVTMEQYSFLRLLATSPIYLVGHDFSPKNKDLPRFS